MPKKRTTRAATPADLVTKTARKAGVRLVRFLYTDNGGVTRGKMTHIEGLRKRMEDGIGLTVAMQAMNMLDQLAPVEGMGPVGEIRLVPDPETFRLLPYAPHSAAMTVDMLQLDGSPWEACPRSFLKRQVAACAETGFSVRRKPVLLLDRHDHRRAGDGRHRRGAGDTKHPSGPVLSRTGTRPTGAVHPPCACPGRCRPAGLLPRHRAQRGLPARSIRLAGAQALP